MKELTFYRLKGYMPVKLLEESKFILGEVCPYQGKHWELKEKIEIDNEIYGLFKEYRGPIDFD